MRLRNAFRILIYHFSSVYKLLLFRLVTNAVLLSLAYAVVSLGLHTIFTSAEAHNILTLIGEFFKAIASGNTEFLASFQTDFTEALTAFLTLLGANIGSIVLSVVGVCFTYLLARFLNGTAIFAMGDIVNGQMEFYGKTGFASAYTKNVGKAALYELIYVPVSFVYDLLAILLCWFCFFYVPGLLSLLGFLSVFTGLAFALTAFVCLEALKMSFISRWIPAVVTGGKSVGAGLKESLCSLRGFGGRFSSFLVAIYLIIALNVLFGLCTFGSMLFLTVPASYILMLNLQFVYYYEDTGKKYFLSFRTISGADGKPESMGD